MIIRNDVTADTYRPLPFPTADLQHLKNAFQDHTPDVELDLGYTDTGLPFISVTVPGAGFNDAAPCITLGERGWQMHWGGDGPLYEFATEREVAEFVGQGLQVAPSDCVGDLVGFLDRVWRDGFESLLAVPRAACCRIAQCLHDVEKAADFGLGGVRHSVDPYCKAVGRAPRPIQLHAIIGSANYPRRCNRAALGAHLTTA